MVAIVSSIFPAGNFQMIDLVSSKFTKPRIASVSFVLSVISQSLGFLFVDVQLWSERLGQRGSCKVSDELAFCVAFTTIHIATAKIYLTINYNCSGLIGKSAHFSTCLG